MYKSRFRRWGLWKHNPIKRKSHPLLCHARAPDELHGEETLYRAVRDYYNGAFSARRWAYEDDSPLAVERTNQALARGNEIYVRFRAAVLLLERPSRGNNGGKAGDFAQGVRLIRISFAELSNILLGSTMEPPMLPLWLLYIMLLFRESPARDFSPVEIQLRKHLAGLTSSSTLTARVRHPTSLLWRALVPPADTHQSLPLSRHHINTIARLATSLFSSHIGLLHPWTVDLSNLAIGLLSPNGRGPPQEKAARFQSLLHQLDTLSVYDLRHINTVCCFASHYRHHGVYDPSALHSGIALLEGVLQNPIKEQVVREHPDQEFNMYSLLANMNDKLGRWAVAEGWMHKGVELARRERERTGQDGDLFEGLNGLEVILRAQGKVEEADTVMEERKKLVREALEGVGEREDSV